MTMKNGPNTSYRLRDVDYSTLTERVILFSRFLKDHGFKIFSSNLIDSLRGLEEIDISIREDFLSVLRANLVTTDAEWRLFGDLFEEFWQDHVIVEDEGKREELSRDQEKCHEDSVDNPLPDVTLDYSDKIGRDEEDACKKESTEMVTYSPASMLEKKNLARFEKGDIQIAQLILKNMISLFRISAKRRFKRSKKPGNMDFRRILRKSLKTGGIPLELFYRKKKKRLKRLVILVDVSGSMDRYARFVMPFILGLKGVGARAEVFVFSTSLTPITPILRRFTIDKALERLCQEVPDWSGGTRIGSSLHQFNHYYGERFLNKHTVVVIMSDGWDLGGGELLRREMDTINKRTYCVVWLNPLAGDPEYRPICKGMQRALSYVDYFMPADSLQSLKKVGRTLSRVMVH